MKLINYYEVPKTHLQNDIGWDMTHIMPETLDGLKWMVGDHMIRAYAHNPVECATCGTALTVAASQSKVNDPALYKGNT